LDSIKPEIDPKKTTTKHTYLHTQPPLINDMKSFIPPIDGGGMAAEEWRRKGGGMAAIIKGDNDDG